MSWNVLENNAKKVVTTFLSRISRILLRTRLSSLRGSNIREFSSNKHEKEAFQELEATKSRAIITFSGLRPL